MRKFVILCVLLLVSPMVFSSESENKLERATFAGGCFWCMEHPFDVLDGVLSTTSGYVGGLKKSPTYQEVSTGKTGHTEAVQVVFNAEIVSYQTLLAVYWHNSDPTTSNRQFCDVGSQYRPGIFYHNATQKKLAEESKAALQKNKPFQQAIVTEISPVGEFWPAESYHQDYYLKNPVRYRFYRYSCGRDQRLEELWGVKGE